MRTELARIRSADGGAPPYDVECRDRVCKVTLLGQPGEHEWSRELQRDKRLRQLTDAMQFSAPTPTNDSLSGAPYMEYAFYASLRDSAAPLGVDFIDRVLDMFAKQEGWKACTRGFTERGTIDTRIDVRERRFRFHIGGTLGGTTVGLCVRERLSAIAAGVDVPPGLVDTAKFVTFTSPPVE